MTDTPIRPTLTSPFKLIDLTWQKYLTQVPLYTKIILPTVIVTLFIETLSYLSEFGTSTSLLVVIARLLERNSIFILCSILIILGVNILSTAALLSVLTSKKNLSVSEAYGLGLKKFFPLCLVALLTGLIAGGGFLLLVVPGIIFSMWFTFTQYILFAEGKGGITALLTSREYVRGYFWQVAGRVLFISFIVGILTSLAGYIAVLFHNQLLTSICESLITLVTIPLGIIYQQQFYEEIRGIQGQVSIKTKRWWLYLVASLLPFVLFISAVTILFFIKPFYVSDNSMESIYKKGAYLVMGEFPGVTSATQRVVYKKDGKLLLRRVLASPGEKLQRKGDSLIVSSAKNGNALSIHAGTHDLTSFSSSSLLPDGKELTVGRNDVYVITGKVPNEKQILEKITIDKVVGVPLFCYWNCY